MKKENKFRKTIVDNRLEELSDKVRRGEPIEMNEVFEVIEYQKELRAHNKITLKDRFINFFKIK